MLRMTDVKPVNARATINNEVMGNDRNRQRLCETLIVYFSIPPDYSLAKITQIHDQPDETEFDEEN